MSAPPLTNPPAMPTMVSRLPKFGSRPKSQTLPSTRLTNGFYHHPGPEGVSGSSTATTPSAAAAAKQNGFIRVPGSFQKWRMEGGETEKEARRGKVGNSGGFHQYYSQRPSPRETKRPTASSSGKGRGLPQQPVTSSSSSSSSPQSSPRTLPVSKSPSPFSKPSQAAASRPKLSGPNAVPGSGPRTGSSLRRPQSFARGFRPSSGSGSQSGSPGQSKTRAGRSFSSDNLGSAPSVPLTQSDRLRSRSLNQVQRQPSPTLTPALSLPRPPRAPPRSRSSPTHTQEGGANGGGVFSSLLPPSALKKPLLPSLGSASKPSGISYRLSRPSLIKQSRPLRVSAANERGSDQEVRGGLNGRRNSVETPSTENSPEITPDAPEVGGLPVSQGEVSIVGETLEDMSLSSTSSLERNDTSQEYMDDFDNLGNGGVGILLLSSKNDEDDSGLDQSCARFDSDDKMAVNGVAKETGLCFLDDGVDWADVRLGGGRGEHRLNRLSRRRRSSQPDDHDQGGSSLDLSPSDSCGSGGTYMWDEEGLEPLGGAATTASIHTDGNTTHHIGSFDSDLNSIDILNNLDSCDLGDDDLMLDVDLPEDASLHGDVDGLSHMAQWRRRQLCWGNDNESDFQSFTLTEDPGNKRTDLNADGGDLILDLCPPSLGLDVEELAEDCSAVRAQLEYLQKLLLQEEDVDEDTLTTDTLSPETNDQSVSSDSQVQILLQEVQQLREDLRSRDRTIAQLTLQLTVPTVTTRCRCQETAGKMDQHTQTSVMESESVASQTPWREHTSQILHSSYQEVQESLTVPALTQAPPPASISPASADCTAHRGEDDGKRRTKMEERLERRGPSSRSLLPPQPSKLRLFLSHTSSAPGSASPKSGVKIRTMASSSSSSRLPKPKIH